jgi:hypothetical protein
MEANPAITGMLGLVLVIGCAGTSVPSGQSPNDSVPAAADNPRCVRQPNVTVHIENQNSHSVGVFFGSSQAKTAVGPFSTTEYQVPRFDLESPIRLGAFGGLTRPVFGPSQWCATMRRWSSVRSRRIVTSSAMCW